MVCDEKLGPAIQSQPLQQRLGVNDADIINYLKEHEHVSAPIKFFSSKRETLLVLKTSSGQEKSLDLNQQQLKIKRISKKGDENTCSSFQLHYKNWTFSWSLETHECASLLFGSTLG